MLRYLILFAALLIAPASYAAGQTRYISDDVYLFLHGGPGTQYRILGSVEAGQPVTFLGETQGTYSKVVDIKGREGWVDSKMLSSQKSFRLLLPEVQAQLTKVKTQLADVQGSDTETKQALSDARQQLTQLKQQLASTTHERDEATAKLASIAKNERFEMWQQGSFIAFLGLVIGIILVYLPRPQRRKKDRWMS